MESVMKGLMGAMPPPRIHRLEPSLRLRLPAVVWATLAGISALSCSVLGLLCSVPCQLKLVDGNKRNKEREVYL